MQWGCRSFRFMGMEVRERGVGKREKGKRGKKGREGAYECVSS